MIRTFIAPALLGVAAVLIGCDTAEAQRVSVGVRVGGSPGYYPGGSIYGRSGYYGGSGIAVGVYPTYGYRTGSLYYGSTNPYLYSGPYTYPYVPSYVPYPVYAEPRIVYVPQIIAVPQSPPVPATTTTHVRVFLPDAQAKVWFDGHATTSTGTERLYHTPAMDPGAKASYRIRASWKVKGEEMVQEQVVQVTGGQTATADFTRPIEPFDPPAPNPAK